MMDAQAFVRRHLDSTPATRAGLLGCIGVADMAQSLGLADALVPAHMDLGDVWTIGASFDALADALRGKATPYPYCYGASSDEGGLHRGGVLSEES